MVEYNFKIINMIIIAIFIFLYFLLVLALLKITDKSLIRAEWIACTYFIFPPIHFAYLTKQFYFCLVLFAIAYFIMNIFNMNGIFSYISYIWFFLPITLWSFLIIQNLKANQWLLILIFIFPLVWVFFILYYLAFFHEPEWEISEDDKLKIDSNWHIIKQK